MSNCLQVAQSSIKSVWLKLTEVTLDSLLAPPLGFPPIQFLVRFLRVPAMPSNQHSVKLIELMAVKPLTKAVQRLIFISSPPSGMPEPFRDCVQNGKVRCLNHVREETGSIHTVRSKPFTDFIWHANY